MIRLLVHWIISPKNNKVPFHDLVCLAVCVALEVYVPPSYLWLLFSVTGARYSGAPRRTTPCKERGHYSHMLSGTSDINKGECGDPKDRKGRKNKER